ncbi:hypothetical protein A5M85_08725 [Cellulophaga lytica]|uniref:hypothetical protein n=1 Tax=Cellulophaga lytica TaxID=979 RepID=UPI0009508846|nr:hypothetical protein [Cellulophaga lytica]APU10361.1 hypothetical protein A5M85_08725 [Cellulophaga lytica]
MKKSLILITALGLIATASLAQQKNVFALDSTLLNKTTTPNITSLYSNKNSDAFSRFREKNLEKYNKQNNFYLTDVTRQKNKHSSKMPVYKPKGNYYTRNITIDTTATYNLKIISPDKIKN